MTSYLEALLSLDRVAVLLVTVTVVVFVIPIFILFPPVPVDSEDVLSQTHSKLGLEALRPALPRRVTTTSAPSSSAEQPRIQSLWVYPVKSCKGIEVSRSKVLPTGLEHDRLYTFAALPDSSLPGQTEENVWRFQTQRQLPLLANVDVNLWLPDVNKTSRALGRPREGFLVLKFPWADAGWRGHLQRFTARLSRGWSASPQKEFMLPLDFPSAEEQSRQGYGLADVKVWKEVVKALDMSKEIPSELSRYLGVKGKLGLFRMDPAVKQREVYRCAPRKETLGYQPIVGFQDAYPLHLLSLQSVVALESVVQKDHDLDYLDPRRFRANILVSGSESYDEDSWKTIRCVPKDDEHGDVCDFDVSCRTVRCKLPNVNPDDGIRHKAEPDHALRHYRNVDEGAPKSGCLGVQMVPIFPEAASADVDGLSLIISVGMTIEVQERAQHIYIPQ